MRKNSKIGIIPEILDRLETIYGKPRFISRFDPIEELVSCILSQHTTDATSFPAFARLREAYPDWRDIVEAGEAAITPLIRAAGLPNQKARSILGCLREIRARNGEYCLENLRSMDLHDARTWLMSLPGVGPKTASIVLCFSFGMDVIPVDTHVYRVSWRIGLIDEKIGERKAHDALLDLVPSQLAFRFHVAFIQHGRQLCRAPNPRCESCPITDLCQWFSGNRAAPAKRSSQQRAKARVL